MGKVGVPRLRKGPKKDEVAQLTAVGDDIPVDPELDTLDVEASVLAAEEGDTTAPPPSPVAVPTAAAIEKKDEDAFKPVEVRPKIPAPPTRNFSQRNSDAFYAWTQTLKPEHWIQMDIYMFRIYPRIIRPTGERNIDCFAHAVTEQWILETHGSGDYHFIVNDKGKPKNAKTLCTANVKGLWLTEHPPKLNYAQLDVNYDGNKRYVDQLIAEGILTTDKKPMNSPQTAGGMNADVLAGLVTTLVNKLTDKASLASVKDPRDTAVTEAFQIMSRGQQAATTAMLENMKSDSPEKLIQIVTLLMGLMKTGDSGGDAKLIQTMMEMQAQNVKLMMDSQKSQFELTVKLIEAQRKSDAPPANVDTEDKFDKMMDRFLKMQELAGQLAGGGGGGNRKWWEAAIEHGMPVLGNAFSMITNLLALRARGVPPIQQNGQQQQQPGQQQRQQQPGQQNGGLPIAIVDAPNPAQTAEEKQRAAFGGKGGGGSVEQAMMESQQEGQMELVKRGLGELGPRIIDALNRRVSGSGFAEGLENMLGASVYDQIAALGEKGILEVLQSDQALWAQLVNRPIVPFVKDFLAYGSDEPEPTPGNAPIDDNDRVVE